MGVLLYEMREFINGKIGELIEWIDFQYYLVDENLLRIAGTGTYKKFVGFNLPLGSATDYVMRTKNTFIIHSPFEHEICNDCPARCSCMGESMIIFPIISNNKTIGAIGIGAFTDEEKERLRINEQKTLFFLKTLSDYISSKINEKKLVERMDFITSYIDEGIVLTDSKGEIIFYNGIIKELLLIGNNKFEHIDDLIPDYDMNKLINNTVIHEKGTYDLCISYVDKKIFLSAKLTEPDKINSEILFIFKTKKNAIDLEYNDLRDYAKVSESISNIKGDSIQIKRVKNLAISASHHDSNVLIRGESGTGKELFARAIHQLSVRKNNPFIAVNCAAIPENLLESELFGYESGAFTGAHKSGKLGKFELANNGTLFLDEIGDMAFHLQPKLLRAIEYGKIEKVGGTATVDLNIRIIAATNRNLEEMIKMGKFREDLYYRLNVIPIFIPPLRNRREDILTLARYFLDKYNKKFIKKISDFSESVERELLLYDWSGNIRELENAIEYAIHVEKTDKIEYESLPAKIKNDSFKDEETLKLVNIRQIEHGIIKELIKKYGLTLEGKAKIAEELGISLSTLYRRLRSVEM